MACSHCRYVPQSELRVAPTNTDRSLFNSNVSRVGHIAEGLLTIVSRPPILTPLHWLLLHLHRSSHTRGGEAKLKGSLPQGGYWAHHYLSYPPSPSVRPCSFCRRGGLSLRKDERNNFRLQEAPYVFGLVSTK